MMMDGPRQWHGGISSEQLIQNSRDLWRAMYLYVIGMAHDYNDETQNASKHGNRYFIWFLPTVGGQPPNSMCPLKS